MTQALPAAQLILNSPKSTANVAAKSESQDGFSDTFRDQFDSRVEDSAREKPVGGASEPAAAPQQSPVDAASEVANPDAAAALEGVVLEQPDGSMLDPGVVMFNDEMVELVDNLSLTADSASMSVAQGAVMPTAATTPTLAVAAAAPSSQSSASASQAITARKLVGDADAPLAPVKAMAEGIATGSKEGAPKDALAQNFARLNDLATSTSVAPAPAASAVIGASSATAQNTSQPPVGSPMQFSVDTPLANPSWGSAMGARLMLGAAQGMQTASITINPRELGPMSVNLTLTDDEASVRFVSQHVLVREAIEAALPRLRELFSGEGITLGEVDISGGQERSNDGGDATSSDDTQADGRPNAAPDSASNVDRVRALDSLIDTFA